MIFEDKEFYKAQIQSELRAESLARELERLLPPFTEENPLMPIDLIWFPRKAGAR